MQNELRRVVDALPGLVWSALPDGQIDFLNQRWCEYTGLSLEEACGWGWHVAVHPEDLQQVILNLLLNASDAMSGVEGRPRQLVIRTERDEGDCVCLSVQDAGVGFEPQDVGRLFEAFYTTKSGGMGIGLSVSRSIIESHHGRLWATRNDGPGATFSFSIPRASKGVMNASSIGAIRTSALTEAEGAVRKA